ncbi:FliI/YscN family ATPase [Sphingomonas colocasiae]|uniref:FliI/YscN family ATPase n=1 Tax=Sphingomonas colocasiae TaxID=1848973 RepID=A0ABS7PX69_9SPHN|nr:FliI/YscN family ATPase [Sphingomonas colocasiae]MBY8825559.1 FliI/YscN family ATPase [Sphingomonas colocasiae]
MNSLALIDRVQALDLFPSTGAIQRLSPGEIEANGPDAPIGAHCEVLSSRNGSVLFRAQVASVSSDAITLVPFQPVTRAHIGDQVRLLSGRGGSAVGNDLAGRAIDALGRPLDGGGPPNLKHRSSGMTDVLDRIAPTRPFATGVRAIDGLLTIGLGQRIGIFAASGVGKTRLIEQVIRQADCQRIIICQIGERGREVEALWSELKGSGELSRVSIVAATSDESAPMRTLCLEQALGMAEFWRDQGEDVLLVVDSVTRYAMALREIGLIAGEPPMLRAYTPNVLRELPRIVERCGAVRSGGSITGLFTVLSEGDDVDDPIVEVMKSLLDGHILLSRKLAEAGHFPAIDVGRSISRLFDQLVEDRQVAAARIIRARLARYEEARVLVESGMYKQGSDPAIDVAISARAPIAEFLRQSDRHSETPSRTLQHLLSLSGGAS